MRPLLLAAVLVAAGCTKAKQEPAPKAAIEFFKVDPAKAGSLSGIVHFKGRPERGKLIKMDAEEDCQKLHSKPVYEDLVIAGKDGGLANVFVYVKTGLEGKVFEPVKDVVVMEQKGCQFVPRVIGLLTGQTLGVKNSDPVSHNIHPMPKNNREWNQQQSPEAPNLERRFGFAEVMIPVKCNVHAWMKSYIGVMSHPYFAVTTVSGDFQFKNLPSGEYTVAAWHEKLGELTEKINVGAGSTVSLGFDFK